MISKEKAIRHKLIDNDLSIKELAEINFLTLNHVSQVIKGNINTSMRTAKLIAQTLDVDVEDIFITPNKQKQNN
ncbi:helix-turn-helix domain-containing protein [Staphylococcus xylosus]